jgi:hypothetical protein
MHALKMTTLVLTLSILGACAKPSADLMSPPPTVEHDKLVGGGVEIDFHPEVDVIFVVDNSESMADEQEKLRQAAQSFVADFGKNSLIDYRVGVMTVYDSRRFGPGKVVENPYPEGKLLPLKTPEGMSLDLSNHPPYVSRFDGSDKVMEATLNVGVVPWNQGGPQFEEVFSPLLVATSEVGNTTLNSNFIRPNSHVAIVIVTDEDDSSSSISVDGFLEGLHNNLGDRFSLYGVLATDKCPRASYADKPDRLTRAIKTSGGEVFSICEPSFGAHLAKIGSDIRKKVMRTELPVPTVPESGTLSVIYGKQVIPEGSGWKFNPNRQVVTINENFKVQYEESAKFMIGYTRVDEMAVRKGRAQPYSGSTSSKAAASK